MPRAPVIPRALFALLIATMCSGCAGTGASNAAPPPMLGAPGAAADDLAGLIEADRARADQDRALFERVGAGAAHVLETSTPAAGAPAPLQIDALRGRIGAHEAVLVYRLAEPHTSLWVITREAFRRIDLPGRGAIEARVDTLRSLLARMDLARGPAAQHSARRLFMMLIASAEPIVREKSDLTIVPDGALWLLPFEALLAAEPNGKGEVPGRGYLVERWSVTYAASIDAATSPRTESVLGGSLALGDPLYERAGGNSDGPALASLPKSALELAVLDQQARGRERVALVGADASRGRLLSEPLLADAGVIHLATHAVATDTEPERSGLWLATDGAGPGYLSLRDVLALDLRARLVALTQCETSLVGPDAGQGVRALSGALHRAGAKQVMMSLWKPLDRSSGLLLDRFYRDLLRKNRPAATALAEAKRQMIKRSETRNPFLWAPLVLIEGDSATR
jgi:CHAT domain-containing protein